MVSRRESLFALAAAPLGGFAAQAAGSARLQSRLIPFTSAARANFRISGTFLNAAYTHPLPLDAAAAMRRYIDRRIDPGLSRAREHPDAVSLFAQLINASPAEIAQTPSTSYGESFVVGALGLQGDRRANVVTDILHFDGSLYTYGELHKQGVGLTILPMTADGRIDMNRMEAAVDENTRLVSISLVSMVNGFEHDLKTVCDIAHRKGARVYVDAVQGAGEVPIDVKASGVDFLSCSTFKWLMGDFGYGFLYVRADLLPTLKRTQFGYHQPKTLAYHALPGDPPGAELFEATPNNQTAAGYFEIGSLSEAAEVAAGVSLQNLLLMDVTNIQRARQPLMDRLFDKLSAKYQPLTPKGSRTAIVAFARPNAYEDLHVRIKNAKLNVQLYKNRFRISPSIYNTMAEVDYAIDVLTA